MSDRPTAYFRVVHAIIHPIPARAGEYIALWLNHPERTLSVIDSQRMRTLRTASMDIGTVSGALLHACLDGTIQGLTPADVSRLRQAS